MKKTFSFVIGFGLVILFISGCSTPEINLDPTLTTYSREILEDMNSIQLPANYNVQNFRKLQMGVSFESIPGQDQKTGQKLEISKDLSTRMQTEMAKLKRFTIFSAHNRGGVMFFNQLADVDGQVKLADATEVRQIDLVLNGKLTVTKERDDRYNDTVVIYEVESDFSCEDMKTRQVKFAEKAKGRTARKQIISLTGIALVGHDSSDESQAIQNAAMKSLAVMANKLGNTYPIGGRITACTPSGERMTLDKGFEDGIGKNQQCVIFVSDGGVDIPVALSEAVPSDVTSNLSVYKWNSRDKDGREYARQFRKDPKAFLNNYKVYAVGYGLPIPPEWDSQGGKKDSMDEQLRLK